MLGYSDITLKLTRILFDFKMKLWYYVSSKAVYIKFVLEVK